MILRLPGTGAGGSAEPEGSGAGEPSDAPPGMEERLWTAGDTKQNRCGFSAWQASRAWWSAPAEPLRQGQAVLVRAEEKILVVFRWGRE